jgi:hypothetical protein
LLGHADPDDEEHYGYECHDCVLREHELILTGDATPVTGPGALVLGPGRHRASAAFLSAGASRRSAGRTTDERDGGAVRADALGKLARQCLLYIAFITEVRLPLSCSRRATMTV